MKHTERTTPLSNGLIRQIIVWDLPTRVFHWTMATAFFTAWFTRGSAQNLDLHVFAGYTMLGLVAFRLLWGTMGGTYARFTKLALERHRVQSYVATLFTPRRQRYIGHNPLASIAIVALILLSTLTLVTGLMVLGGQKQQGPLADWLTFDQGALLNPVHEWLATALLALVVVHILGAVTESLLHRDNLIGSMIHGRRHTTSAAPSSANFNAVGTLLITVIATAAGVSYWPWLMQDANTPYQPFKGPALFQDAAWQEECGSCHLAYHPSLLPARSWHAILATQDAHFGEDLGLDTAIIDELARYAEAQAAELHQTETAWQIDRRVAPSQTPLRISDTRYWKAKHRPIADAVWRTQEVKSKANCDACHSDAKSGGFQPAAMRIPGAASERIRQALRHYAERIVPMSTAAAETHQEAAP